MRFDPWSPVVPLVLILVGLLGFFALQAGVFTSPDYVERQPYPDRPAELTRDTVTQYAIACENATVWNTVIAEADPDPVRIAVSMNTVEVSEVASGWHVHLEYGLGTWYADDTHGDSPASANYLINGSVTLRSSGGGLVGGELEPARNGTVVTDC